MKSSILIMLVCLLLVGCESRYEKVENVDGWIIYQVKEDDVICDDFNDWEWMVLYPTELNISIPIFHDWGYNKEYCNLTMGEKIALYPKEEEVTLWGMLEMLNWLYESEKEKQR